MRLALVTIVLLIVGVAGCAGRQPEPAPETPKPVAPAPEATLPEPLLDIVWRAERIYGEAAGAADSTLTLSESGSVTGSAGCNRFSGDAEIDGSALSIGMLATTRMMCEPAVNGQEQAFLEALAATRSWRRMGRTLDLLDEQGRELMRMTPAD